MSSHHFVREGQEPSLFILDPVSYSLIAPLLEWVPLVITTQVALDKILSWGIKVDMVLFTEDQRVEISYKTSDQWPITLVPCDQELDFLRVGLAQLRGKGHRASHVMVENAHAIFEKVQNTDLTISILDKACYWTYWNRKYAKYLPVGEALVLEGTIENQDFVSADKRILPGKFRVESSHVTIESNAGFWVGEHHA
jgi:hypothetical protein